MKWGASLPPCDWKTKDAFANMDAAGYNYGIRRYKHDLKKYPHRLIVGSETFCSDAYRFYELAKHEPRLLGDFVWAGMDYLGEARGNTRTMYRIFPTGRAGSQPGQAALT
jgi:beta-galactosidase